MAILLLATSFFACFLLYLNYLRKINYITQRNQNATILNAVGQQIAPLAAGLQALQGDVDGIKCKMPPTVAVPYPQLQVYNPETFRAAAFGAYAGDVAYGRSGYGCGNNYWG